MKAAIVLLSSAAVQNYVRRIVFALNAQYKVGLFASLLPSHVSLKQPFTFESMDVLETYFDNLAGRIAPFEIELNRFYSEEWAGYGILGLNVVETPILRGLHNRINAELSQLFKDTRAPHDGSGYRFHLTIEAGKLESANPYQVYFDHLSDPQVKMAFQAQELGLFYYPDETYGAGPFITYRVMPLRGQPAGGQV